MDQTHCKSADGCDDRLADSRDMCPVTEEVVLVRITELLVFHLLDVRTG